jgi:hypothetical protein
MDAIHRRESAVAQTARIRESLAALTGRTLFEGVADPLELSRLVFEAPFVLVSHGTEPDPILNYGNRRALELWEMPFEVFTKTPSRLTAEAPVREERARLLDAVARRGFIDDYAGVRVSATGRRFMIERAVVWNLSDEGGRPAGQAAMFEHWTML